MVFGRMIWTSSPTRRPTTESWLIYGRTHQPTPDGTDPLCVNIGMDAWDMKPVNETQVVGWFTAANRTATQAN